MKKNIKVKISKFLFNLINQNSFIKSIFDEIFAHNIIITNNIKSININLLFYENYFYYIINLKSFNSEIKYYGKIKSYEININII